MENAAIWHNMFQKWPAEIPKRGIMVTSTNETHPFKGFMMTDKVLVLDRTNPDPMGARIILVAFQDIAAIKLIDALNDTAFAALGFVGKFGK